MKNFKRIVGLLLCLAMVLSFVPASIFPTTVKAAATTTSDILEKIDISGTAVGACSTNSASQSDYTKLSWWNDTHSDWGKHLKVVDNSRTSSCDFGATLSDGEKGDFYLDLTKKNGSAISADRLELHYGADEDADMPTVTIILDLETGSDVERTFTTNWSSTTAGDPIEWDFGQTYDIDGIYVYSENATDVSFAELELYQYIEIPYLETATLNGVDLSQYKIVYSDDEPDYNYTAAKYIKEQILMRTGRSVEIVTDSAAETNYEILVGETNRSLSASTSAPGNHAMKFTINASGTKIALEADYFIIAGAAYYFVDTYIGTENFENTVSAGSRELTPITKKAKNYIFLIGDGMGVMQTRLWEKHGPSPKAEDDATYGYSDGENIFYGEYLPYKGFSKTANVKGTITDSAAGGTALATGYKTINGYVGRDQYENDIKNLSEIAWDMGKAVGIMSTEGSDGATPAAFSAHTSGRYDNEVISDQDVLEAKGYVFVERYRSTADAYNAVFKTYTAEEFGRWDAKVKAGMSKLVNDPDGFFVMYEEAYIDKLSHALQEEGNPNATTTEDIFRAMYRFNQHIAYFMEFAMYNPDTFVLITADHETAGLDENWNPTQFNVAPETGNDHSLQDVPVYVYGQGGEVFHGVTAENTSIGRTFAHIMTDGNANDFGDPQYPILLGSSSGEDVQLPTPEGLKATATTDTSITVTANGVYGGTLKFRINGGEWQSSGIFTGLTASTTYTIEAMHDAAAGYIDSDIATITVTTAEPAVKVDLEPVPTNKLTNAMFGYYGQNISGDITTHLYDNTYPANKAIDGTDSETRSGLYNYSDLSGTLENQQKVPVIYIELTEATVLGGVEIKGWEYDRYNMENFVVQITTEENNDNWKTVATVTQAFTEGDRGTACPPLTVEFNKTYTAYKVRILVDSISDMSSEAQGDDAGLAQYGYIRVKEVTPLYDPSATPGQTPGDPTEPTTPPTQPTEAPTTPDVNPDDPNEQGVVLQIVPATKITPQFGVYTDANLTAFVGGNDAYCLTDGWFGRHADSQKKTTDGTIAAILTLDKTTTLGGIEIVGRAEAGNDMTSYRVQVKTANGWETVVTATSNPFDSGNRTVKYEFATPVATDEVRIVVDSCESTECKIGEIVLYEATNGKAYELIDLAGKGSSTDANPANPVDNLGDTDKTTIFLGSNATFNLTVDGQPTAVDGFNLFAYRGNNSHPTSVQVFVQQDEDGEYVKIGTFDTGWSNTYPLDSLTATFDQTYYAYNIRFEFDGWDYVNGLELYGYVQGEGGEEPTEPTEPTQPTTPTETVDPDEQPSVTMKPITNAPTPIVGYYTDTNGTITEYLNEDTNKGKVPAVLVDGKTGSSADYNWTGYYRYDDVENGTKVPAYLFEFDEPTAFTGVTIDGYKAMYYGIEDFTVQVYIEGKGWVTATTVADSFGAQTQEEYADPVTYAFAEPLYGTKIRILVTKLWSMYDWRYDDENSFNLEYESSIRLREITLMEDPDYVPPEDTANTLMPPSSLDTEFTDTTITAVAPPSTEYPEAEIRYAVYLDGELVAANSTGIFTGLKPNTRYTVYAKYIGDGEIWQNSSAISNTTATDKLKLPTPNVEVDLTSTSITATADEVEGGELQFRLLDANKVAIGEWQSSGNFTGLTPNTTYYIQARYNGDTNHYDSEVRMLEVETGKTLLNKPTLTVSGTTHNTITLNALAAVTGGAAEYSYSVDGTNWITATGTVITGLTPNTTYYLRARYVAADSDYNTSLYSEVITATTKLAPLTAPVLSVSGVTDSGFTVSAEIVANGTLKFRVNGGEWQESGVFTGLNRNTTYTVEAMYVAAEGYVDSEIASAQVTTLKTQLSAPTGLTVTDITDSSFTVSADTNANGTLKFRVNGGEWQTSGTFAGLNRNTTYTIEAMYDASEDFIDSAAASTQATTLKTQLSAPTGLTATDITDSSITVTADANANGTLMFRVNGGAWQTSGTFTGLKRNAPYTVEAMYVAAEGFIDSDAAEISVTTLKTQLNNPTGFKETATTVNSITVKADTVTGGTLKFSIDSGSTWQTAVNGSYTFTGLTDGTKYTIWAKYFADEDYIDSNVTTTSANTWTILPAPDLTTTTVTDISITVSAPSVTGGTAQYRINSGAWQTSGVFTGLKSNTIYTVEAKYVASAGYVDSAVTTLKVTTATPADPTAGEYAYLEAIREADVTAHVGYNIYSNHNMWSENLEQSALISDAMFGTVSKIMGKEAVPADKLADGYRLLSVVYDLNNGATKLGAIEITGGSYNLTEFAIQVKNTKGLWQTVKFVTNDLFDISTALKNDTVLIPFTPVEGTQLRLLISGYEANANNYPEIREMVLYEVKDDARQELKAATSTDAPVAVDGNKATVFTGNTATLSFNEATSVKRVKLFGNTESDSVGGYSIKVQTAKGGAWTEVASGNAYGATRAFNTNIVNLDKEYTVYGIQVITDGTVSIPEIEVYGYMKAPEYVDPTPETVPGATAPTEATRLPVVSPVATQPITEKFEVPNEPDGAEPTVPAPNVGGETGDEPTVAVPSVGDETAKDPTVAVPSVGDETGNDPTVAVPSVDKENIADPVAPTAPVVTQPTVAVSTTPEQITVQSAIVGVYNDGKTYANLTAQQGAAAVIDGNTSSSVTVGTGNDDWIYNTSGFAGNGGNYTPAAILTLEKATSVNRVVLYPFNSSGTYSATDVTIQYLNGSTWTTVGSYEIKDFSGPAEMTFASVTTTKIRVLVDNIDRTSNSVTAQWLPKEIQLYGYAAGGVGGTYTPGTPDYTEISLSKNNLLGACSANSASQSNVFSMSWYFSGFPNNTDKSWANWFDDDYTNEAHWGISSNERGDFLLDLSNGGSGTAVDRIRVSSSTSNGYKTPTSYQIVMLLTDGSQVTKTFATGWSNSTAKGTIYTYDLDKTYMVTKMYVWANENTPDTEVVFGQFELFTKQTVTLDAPTVAWTSKNDTSVTVVAAKIDSSIGKLQFSIDGGSTWKDATNGSYTFTGLTGNKNYTIQAKYVATADGYVSSGVGSTSVTTEATPTTSFAVSGTTTAGATVNLYKNGTLKTTVTADGSGKFSFSGVATGAYTLQFVKAGYTPDTLVISVNQNVTNANCTLSQPTYTVSGTTNANATVKLYKDGAFKTTVTADGSGNFTFTGVVIGNYTLQFIKDGYTPDTVVVTVNQNVTNANCTLSQPTYTVSGTTNANATVKLYKDGAFKTTVTADGSGNFTFTGVVIGNYTLQFVKDGYTPDTVVVTVNQNVTNANCTLTQAVYTVSGTTTAGATVQLYKNGAVVKTATAINGSYSFTDVAIGNYTVVVTMNGYNPEKQQITVNQTLTVAAINLTQAVYTISGTTNAGATVTLYKNKTVVLTTAANENGAYSFGDVAIGKYTLVFSKDGYVSKAVAITVDSDKTADTTLEVVPIQSANVVVDAVVSHSYNVRLYEPWALRVNVTFYTAKNGTAIDLSTFKSYGAFAVIANKYDNGATAPESWEDIVSNPNAVQFRMAAGEGDCNIFAANNTTARFDYYDGLYTYRLAENVYWVAYYEDAEGTIHFTGVNNPVLMDKVDNVIENIADDENQETQRIVLEHMKQLHYALIDFRGEDANLGNTYTEGVLNYGQNLKANTTGGDKYQFGKSHRIRLIEPWGIMINMQVRVNGATYDFSDAQDYGLIFFHDKKGEYGGTMTSEQMLARNDVYIYSKNHGNAWLESWNTNGYLGITAAYDKDILTYEMDSELYYVPFVVDAEGNYHYSTKASCLHIIDEMYNYYNRTNLSNKERATFRAMIELYESTIIHRKKYGYDK